MSKWSRAKAGTSYQSVLEDNAGHRHVLFRKGGEWGYIEWDADLNKIDRGQIFGGLNEAKKHVEEWRAV